MVPSTTSAGPADLSCRDVISSRQPQFRWASPMPHAPGAKRMSLGLYLIKRCLYAVPLMIGAIVLIFTLVRLAPGNPVDYIIGEMGADPAIVARLMADMGLDQPIHVQLFAYIRQILSGDLGYSFVSNAPVSA